MAVKYGRKRNVVGAHYGTGDWLAQRFSAALMAVFTLVLLLQLLAPGPLGYDKWAGIFAAQWMKVLTFSTIVALGWHAWIGMRNIFMDYVKPIGVRLVLMAAAITWLLGCMGWAVQVLWRV